MASDSSSETSSFLEQIINSRNRDLSSLLPLIFGFSDSPRREPEDQDQETGQIHDRIILINPFTQGMIVIEGSRSLDALIREVSNKEGPPPASKASVDAMPKVVITEEDGDGECSICLDGWEIGGEAREMPCKHKYHSICIEKWLGIHGSCPVCRFKMPVDEDECKKRSGSREEERGRRVERGIWVSFSFSGNNSRRNSTTSSDSDSSSSPTTQEDVGFVDGSSNINSEDN